MNRKLRLVTRTALLLAIAILFQFLGKFMGSLNNFIVGPVINAVLLISSEIVGVFSGLIISIATPIISALTNKSIMAPVVLAFSPFIISGNAIFVLCYFFLRKRGRIIAIAVGAVAKAAFLYASISVFTRFVDIKAQWVKVLIGMFSWPQLITAIIGGAIAVIVIPVLKKAVKN